MVNTMLLKGKIVANGLTQRVLAEKMKISENNLSAKITGKSEFDLSQVMMLCEILNINDPDEKCKIFLC